MTVELTECNGSGGGLFEDLGTYPNVDKWLEAMRDGDDATRALDVFVNCNGKSYCFKSGGCLSADADKIIKWVARLPHDLRAIPNDLMKIKADAFECELFISMAYQT